MNLNWKDSGSSPWFATKLMDDFGLADSLSDGIPVKEIKCDRTHAINAALSY